MSDSNNITVLNPGLYKNLLAQVEAIYKHSNELALKQELATLRQQKGSVSF